MNSTQASPCEARVITTADRVRGIEAWLFLDAQGPVTARQEWQNRDSANLRCGCIFTVMHVPGAIVRAAADSGDAAGVNAVLAEVLAGGAVFPCPERAQRLGDGIRIGAPAVQYSRHEPVFVYRASPMCGLYDLRTLDQDSELVKSGYRRLAQTYRRERGAGL